MENIKISLSEQIQKGNISEVRVDGVIDTLTAGELEQVIESLLKRERCRIVVDLAGVDYISSAGWGIFISHIRDVRGSGGDIKLVNMQPDVSEIFELLEFDNVLESFSSIGDAVSAFSPNDDSAGDSGKKSSGSVKKKELTETRVTIVSKPVGEHSSEQNSTTTQFAGGSSLPESDLETQILCFVKSDPFASIFEIRNHLNRASNRLADKQIGWWQVFNILRRYHLIRRKSRFSLAWGHFQKPVFG